MRFRQPVLRVYPIGYLVLYLSGYENLFFSSPSKTSKCGIDPAFQEPEAQKLILREEIEMSILCSRTVIALSLALAVGLPCATRAQTPPCTTATLQTPLGPICGLLDNVTVPGTAQPVNVSKFLGVRYAQKPTRWQNPAALSAPAWSGTFSATQFGDVCAQNSSNQPGSCSFLGSEDCLFLNIYVPGNAAAGSKLPVMVFIHGGGFVNGAGSQYDGSELAASGNVIVVTINYRLGPFGFLALSPITDTANNNFGFRDQIMALQWVQSYIPSFGGDAGNVTIFGESAGAMSVGLHALSSPQSLKFFQAALMESNPLGLPYKSLSQANTYGNELSSAVGCKNASSAASCMGQVPAQTLACTSVSQLAPVLVNGLSDMLVWGPAIDLELITGQPMTSAATGGLTVPMVLGTNLNEGTVFANLMVQEAKAAGRNFGPLAYATFIVTTFGLNSGVLAKYPCPTSSTDCSQPLGQLITDYMFTCANRAFAKSVTTQTSSNPNPNEGLYLYQFTEIPPAGCNVWQNANVSECAQQVCHGQEVPYVFDTPQNVKGGSCAFGTINPGDQALSNNMQAYWTNFAKGRIPNASGLFQWPVFGSSGSYIVLNQALSTTTTSASAAVANCDFWDTKGYGGLPLLEGILQSLKSE